MIKFYSVRNAYSSVLCGQWNPYQNQGQKLVLDLCKKSELSNVSAQINQVVEHYQFEHSYDSWRDSLLNNLFHLYSEWDPF